MKTLLDLYGNPIDFDRLRKEESAPTITGVRQLVSGHPWVGLTPFKLGQILRNCEEGDPVAFLEVAEEAEERDLHYRSVLNTRRLQVAQLPVTVEAASDDPKDQEIAEAVREHLVEPTQRYLYDMLDAVAKPWSVGEIVWETGKVWKPKEIIHRDPRWFVPAPDGQSMLLVGGADGMTQTEPLKPFGYVVHHHRTKSGAIARGGLARPAIWMVMFKSMDVKSWIEFLEGYGQPTRLGKYPRGATAEEKRTLLRAVSSMYRDAAAIVPEGMTIEWLESKLTGNVTAQQAFADWADRQVSKLVLGQTGTTDAGQHVGTADAHEHVRSDIEVDDANQIALTCQRSLVRPFVDLNYGADVRAPRLALSRPCAEDLKAYMESVKSFVAMGGKVEMSVVRDKLGLPDPEPGAECLRPEGAPDPAVVADPTPPVEAVMPTELATASQTQIQGDALDDLAAEALADWEPAMTPLVDPIQSLLDQCKTHEEFMARLPEVLANMNAEAMTEMLAKALFMARAAGEVEVLV